MGLPGRWGPERLVVGLGLAVGDLAESSRSRRLLCCLLLSGVSSKTKVGYQ